MTSRILHGDLRQRIPELIADGVMVDAIVCDPPYELTAKRPGGRSEATRGAVMGGFMGMKWDGTGIAFDPEAWALCLQILKPGGYMLAFGGTRTHHRVMCAIEDAGFELRDVLMWVFGSGFPKSKNHPDEHPGMGTALKPAWEPIILARKPMPGTVLENMNEHGVGMLNIDACRISVDDASYARNCSGDRGHAENRSRDMEFGMGCGKASTVGRWPANLVHDGSDEVLSCFPDAPGQQRSVGPEHGDKASVNTFGDYGPRDSFAPRGDSGSSARFFYCAKASREDRNEGCDALALKPLAYGNQAQAEVKRGNNEHAGNSGMNTVKMVGNHHPTVKPTDLMRWLCRLVTPPGGLILDPFTGSGSTGKAAALEGFDFIGIELEAEYVEIAKARIAFGEAERKLTTSQQELCI